ncbi:polar amino acid transport system substrate-binding protein [Methanophagales archaeon]|nr:polar amino acid transport system substrate-binding protein [Methanophagales archaeon]
MEVILYIYTSRYYTMKWILIACFMLVFCVAGVSGESELVVGVKDAEPFVIVADNGSVSGFSIDLLEHMIAQLEEPVSVSYLVDPNLPTHLASIRDGKVDFGIAATTITSERLCSFDFSQPFYISSLGIIAEKGRKPNLLSQIFTKEIMGILLIVLIYIVTVGHIVWFIEREEEGHFHTNYRKGVATGIWWTIVTMSTVGYGDVYPKKPRGKAFAAFVIISGIAIFGFAIATLSSTMVVSQLPTSSIPGPDDLYGRPVAVIAGTESVTLAEERGMHPVLVETIAEGITLLKERKVDAVVHDSPLLKYYLKNHPDSMLALAPQTFEWFLYGITYPKDSPWSEKLNPILIKTIYEDEYNKELHTKWFGVGE